MRPLEFRAVEHRGPDPVLHPEVEHFWSSIGEGYLRLQRCEQCQTLRFPICSHCHNCLSSDYRWEDIEPEGTVATVVRVERVTTGGVWGQERVTREPAWKEAVPYVSALVDMTCGVRLPGRLLCHCGLALQRGTPVHAVAIETESGKAIYAFAHDCKS